MFKIKDFTPRLYQINIFNTCIDSNTLVVLPTGTGKTKIAVLLAVHRLNQLQNSKVLICTPTKPLASQICNEFKFNTDIPNITLLTGAVKPKDRKDIWESSSIIAATPQTIESDLKNNRITLKNVSLLVIDECHRSRQRYANTILAKNYIQNAASPRILALTASPGSTKDKINEIKQNLFIDKAEIRTEQDADVKQYIPKKETEWISIELPDSYKEILKLFREVYKEKLSHLKNYGLTKPISLINKKDLLEMQKDFQQRIKQRDMMAFSGISLIAQLLKLNHTMELLETQGISSFKKFINKLKTETTKASSVILNNKTIAKALEIANKTKEEHPKLKKLSSLILEQLEENKNSRILVFTNYRFTIDNIQKYLSKFKQIKPAKLIGQKEGLSQKQQIETIKNFESGVYNALICSSIGEEGLSISGATLCVFYDHVYGIRRIQRAGRVARTMPGKIIYLITKGTRDAGMYWKSKRDITKMTSILKHMKKEKQSVLCPK